MYYEINISRNGRHFFATAKRSLISMKETQEAYSILGKKFPPEEGYEIKVSRNEEISRDLKIKGKTIVF